MICHTYTTLTITPRGPTGRPIHLISGSGGVAFLWWNQQPAGSPAADNKQLWHRMLTSVLDGCKWLHIPLSPSLLLHRQGSLPQTRWCLTRKRGVGGLNQVCWIGGYIYFVANKLLSIRRNYSQWMNERHFRICSFLTYLKTAMNTFWSISERVAVGVIFSSQSLSSILAAEMMTWTECNTLMTKKLKNKHVTKLHW